VNVVLRCCSDIRAACVAVRILVCLLDVVKTHEDPNAARCCADRCNDRCDVVLGPEGRLGWCAACRTNSSFVRRVRPSSELLLWRRPSDVVGSISRSLTLIHGLDVTADGSRGFRFLWSCCRSPSGLVLPLQGLPVGKSLIKCCVINALPLFSFRQLATPLMSLCAGAKSANDGRYPPGKSPVK